METKTEITDLDIFLRIKNHLLNQNTRCMNDMDDCGYFGLKQSTKDAIIKEIEDHHNSTISDEDSQDFYEWEHAETIGEAFSYALEKFVLNYHDESKLLRCAVGAIMDPKFYYFSLEGQTIRDDQVIQVVRNSNPNWDLDLQALIMLESLQVIHDTIEVNNWPWFLNEMEKSFDDSGSFVCLESVGNGFINGLKNTFIKHMQEIRQLPNFK